MQLLQLLPVVTVLAAFAAAFPHPNINILTAGELESANCNDCAHFFDQCLNTCGPMDTACQSRCNKETCLNGPAHCHKACSRRYCFSSTPHDYAEPDCTICDDWQANCTCECTHEDRYCRLGCQGIMCFEGPAECRGDTVCGRLNHCDVVGAPPTPQFVEARALSTPTSSTSAQALEPTDTPNDDCAPCVRYFEQCMDECPVKNPLGCVNVCKFKTCNVVTEDCPSDCVLGFGATMDSCNKKVKVDDEETE
ncbi:hypothetical protein BU26DRAFT_74726 [Trematosphaeria pertusa]|uniref:Uncharacterized protein n=1 Tax=Trematosphaeria pertusa TaxID=390896 RepID=A0A6A6I603_9PLEO|nr:uncharacterized protein BU26DRAFT_74726 [Trematosphaeria pertusa]KAF2245747.1 hypothetical protein BU26DRAFT_74726 [Trematosphaeria pertusa]